MTGKRSRRIKQTEEGGSLPEGHGYCRRCMEVKTFVHFYKATDMELDKSGFFSVCKECINELVSNFINAGNSIQITVLKLCKMLNVEYNDKAIEAALKQIESKDSEIGVLFGLYRAKLIIQLRTGIGNKSENIDMTYKDNPIINVSNAVPSEDEVERDVVKFWGNGYSKEEYGFLEDRYSDWASSHKNDTAAERALLREVIFKELEINKARAANTSTGSLVNEFQSLLKTASLDPSKTNIANSGRNQDTFSAFIKMIEQDEPAEVFGEERDAFRDFSGIEKYFEKYVTRPLKNFITMSRDFNVSDSGEEEDSEFNLLESTSENESEGGNEEDSNNLLDKLQGSE